MRECCPTCGRAYVAKRPKADPVVDTSTMTNAEIFAYYKRIAPAEDLRFFLRFKMSDALRQRAESVSRPTPAILAEIRTAWRIERLKAARAAGIPAIGSPEWAKRQQRREARAVAERARQARLEPRSKAIESWRIRHPHGWEKARQTAA